MDYESDNYMRANNTHANMHQHELQHKLQQQQHQEQNTQQQNAEEQKQHLQSQQNVAMQPAPQLRPQQQQQRNIELEHQAQQHIPPEYHQQHQHFQPHHHHHAHQQSHYLLQQQFQHHQLQQQHLHQQYQYQQQQQQQQQHHHHHHHPEQQRQQRSPETLSECTDKKNQHLQQIQHQQESVQASNSYSHNMDQQNHQLHQPLHQQLNPAIQTSLHYETTANNALPTLRNTPAMNTSASLTTPTVTTPASTTLHVLSQEQQLPQIDIRNNIKNIDNLSTATPQSTFHNNVMQPYLRTANPLTGSNFTTLPIAENSMHYAPPLVHITNSNNNSNNSINYIGNNKTESCLTSTSSMMPQTPSSTPSSLHPSLQYGSMNGMENAAVYSKFYQTYGQQQFTHHHHPHPPHIHHHLQQFSTVDTTIETPSTAAADTVVASSTTTATSSTTTTRTRTTSNDADTSTSTNNDDTSPDSSAYKRKNNNSYEEAPDMKKALEDKKNLALNNLRKNIRDVMDETQLDTTTIAAQREESERLARVAEQQKAMREYQRQTAANRQFARTQNRVMSLLQSGKTYAKFTDSSPVEPFNVELEADNSNSQSLPATEVKSITISGNRNEILESHIGEVETVLDEEKSSQSTSHSIIDGDAEPQQTTGDVVTIEDSSSEDDCILLSDDEDDLMDDDEEETDDPHNSGLHVQDSYNVPDEMGRVVINVGHPEGEEDIFVAPQIARTIKPHQIGGVRFLFDNIIESTKRFKNSSGFGCILAHSMGLGKTLQVVCFCDIFLRHTNSKTVLCVMPINTLQNWVNEFNMWTPRHSDNPSNVRPRHFDVFVLNDQHKTLSARAKVILRWAEEGGVLLIGYELFRLLALKILPTRKRRGQKQVAMENTGSEAHKRLTESIFQALVKPGPDLVICDEGHRIKNAHAGISMALKQIRTRRRIVLTGYPLQNNLLEYWCMVDFVRPNYLGTRTEFCNMFERPIQNGQCIDSTPEDIRLMRYRAHVLHSLLVGFVQRRSHMVLQQTLPQKLEYVILTRMTSFQRQLYDTFMNDVVRTRTVPNPLKAFSVCCKIWNHPDVLYNFLKRYEHDLDIEIEEGEIVPDTPAVLNNAALTFNEHKLPSLGVVLAKNTSDNSENVSETIVTPLNPPTSLVTANFVEESQTSSSGFGSMIAPTSTPTPTTEAVAPAHSQLKYDNNNYSSESGTAIATTANDGTTNNSSKPADAGGNQSNNNYWLEPNLPYYTPFPTVMPTHHAMQQPDYVGIMVKPSSAGIGENVHSGSSEIVDLDTKEIKTVETDIDMEPKVLKSDIPIPETPNKENSEKETNEDKKVVTPTEHLSPLTISENKMIEREPSRWADGVPYDWALDLMKKYDPDLIENSPKMEVFFCILQQSIELNDRVLLFSQSLLTLNLIERFLQANCVPGTENNWARNMSYFRLDGSTSSQEREKLVNEFNSNQNVKLFLISTRAGSLGINLVGANRVVVFDASWNPCHDTQAVYRIYR